MIFYMEFMAVVAICLTPVFVAITASIVHTKRTASKGRYALCLANIKRLEAELWPELYGVTIEKRTWLVDSHDSIQMVRNPYNLTPTDRVNAIAHKRNIERVGIPGQLGPG